MARQFSFIAVATAFLLAAWGGEARAQTPVDVLGGAGGFDSDDWFFQGPDSASFAREACEGFTGNCARIEGDDLGTRAYDAQLIYWNGAEVMPKFVSLQSGKVYRIQLKGSASTAGKTIQVALEDSGYIVVSQASFTLGTTPTVHTSEPITVRGSRDVSVRVNVGGPSNDGVTFSVDDLAILEEEGEPPPPPGPSITEDFEDEAIGFEFGELAWGAADIVADVADDPLDPGTGNNVLRLTTHNYNAAPVIVFTLPEGKTLANYRSLTFKGHFASGDVGWKHIVVYAYGTAPTGAFATASAADYLLGDYNRDRGASEDWETITVDISNASTLSGTVYVAFGYNGSASVWYADDVSLAE